MIARTICCWLAWDEFGTRVVLSGDGAEDCLVHVGPARGDQPQVAGRGDPQSAGGVRLVLVAVENPQRRGIEPIRARHDAIANHCVTLPCVVSCR
ncbi:MAG: hypothetical protein H0T51_07830 [Pirellulales bacterium]|nr:hypothetical protein [Pirellulales bacterium]